MKKLLRALIVEDSEDDALLVVRELSRAGYEPEFARVETRAALSEALASGSWDVVLSDFSMPEFDGLSALQMVRERGSDIPFILVSGAVGESVAVQAMKAGAHDYILKDNLARLAPAVERELREAEVRRERRRAEAALRQSENLQHALLDATTASIFFVDPDRRILLANRAAAAAARTAPEQLLGRDCREVLPHQADADDCMPLAQALKSRALQQAVVVDSDGRAWDARAEPVLDQDGELAGVVVIAQDITEKRRLDERLQQSQRMESLGRLAGGVAHDFNNILTVIRGYTTFLRRSVQQPASALDDIKALQAATTRAVNLVGQLLAFSRRQVVTPELVDLTDIVTGLQKMLPRLIGEDVRLEFDLEEHPWKVLADRGQMEQIIMNLVVNARDALPRGGTINIRTRCVVREEEGAQASREWVTLTVADDGVGMDQATMSHIFEPFFTTKAPGHGTGLGLATVYGIVEQGGGEIRVDSQPGEGTMVIVSLPKGEVAAAVARSSSYCPPARGLGEGETVLVAEDDELLRQLVARVLESEGYCVLQGSHGKEALAVAQKHAGPVHLLLTDLIMPEMDGTELARRLPETRVLYMTGYWDDSFVREGRLPVDCDCLPKPFSPEILLQRVRAALDAGR
jgi:PAS domain S-box-containing protein